jgi:hypothetical protein
MKLYSYVDNLLPVYSICEFFRYYGIYQNLRLKGEARPFSDIYFFGFNIYTLIPLLSPLSKSASMVHCAAESVQHRSLTHLMSSVSVACFLSCV